MRKSNRVFTPAERRLAFWALIATVIVTLGGVAIDRATGPSLGVYGFDAGTPPGLPGMIEAQPLG